MKIYLLLVLLMSIITFILYGIDKRKAIKNQYRIKEKTLLLSSFLFGSVGGILGMYIFRHKTKHWYFVVVNFISLVLHIIVGYYIFKTNGHIVY